MNIPEKGMITIDELKVDKLNVSQKNLDLSFGYSLQGQTGKVSKRVQFGDDTVNFVLNVMNEIKRGKPLTKIENESEMKEKLVNHLRRLLKEVDDLGKINEQTRYMREFNRINCYKIKFPEIVI